MNKSFILLDKNSNLQKNATSIVKFNFEEKDYLVYSVDENEQNCQIFVSRLILNSEGKYFLDNLMSEEKNKLNNIVYNIVILLPSEVQKDSTFENSTNNLRDKFFVELSSELPELNSQEYYSNCSIAITNKLLVESAIKLYDDNLLNVNDVKNDVVPTWTAPAPVTAPEPVTSVESNVNNAEVGASVVSVQQPVVETLNLQSSPILENTIPDVEISSVSLTADNSLSKPMESVVSDVSLENKDVVLPNPQTEKLAIVSDPSLGIGVQQPNIGKNKKAGFANTKYIVVGTVCLVLAIAVVVTAFILIKNMG